MGGSVAVVVAPGEPNSTHVQVEQPMEMPQVCCLLFVG